MKKYPIVPIKHPSPDDFEIGRRKVLGLKNKSKERGEREMTNKNENLCRKCKHYCTGPYCYMYQIYFPVRKRRCQFFEPSEPCKERLRT